LRRTKKFTAFFDVPSLEENLLTTNSISTYILTRKLINYIDCKVYNQYQCVHIKVHFLMMLILYTNNLCIFDPILDQKTNHEIYAHFIVRNGESIFVVPFEVLFNTNTRSIND
jgi:hypothetical protein